MDCTDFFFKCTDCTDFFPKKCTDCTDFSQKMIKLNGYFQKSFGHPVTKKTIIPHALYTSKEPIFTYYRVVNL